LGYNQGYFERIYIGNCKNINIPLDIYFLFLPGFFWRSTNSLAKEFMEN
jgi:hypothetical protein